MRTWGQALAIAAAVVFAVLGIHSITKISNRHIDRGAAGPARTEAAPGPAEIRAVGRIEAQHVIQVAVPFGGKVTDVLVQPGENVVQGQLLAHIESSTIDTERENALADLERAESRVQSLQREINKQRLQTSRSRAAVLRAREQTLSRQKAYDRQQVLLSEGATPRQRFEQSRREYERARAENDTLQSAMHQADDRLLELSRDLDSARKLLDLRSSDLDSLREQTGAGQVLSPVTGTVMGINAHVGDIVDPSTADMIELATNLRDLQVNVMLSSSDTKRLKPGMPALIEIAESANQPLDGVVKSLDATRAVVVFSTLNFAIRPGLSALVRFRVR